MAVIIVLVLSWLRKFEKVLCHPVANAIKEDDQIGGRECMGGFSVNVSI